MDKWRFYDIIHQKHVCYNPMLPANLDRLLSMVELKPGSSVVDIACGNAELLIRLAEAYEVKGMGVDVSPYFVAKARSAIEARCPSADLQIVEQEGKAFTAELAGRFDLVSCIGASWIFGGHSNTLKALTKLVEPGGLIIVGEPFWIKEPADDYLEASGIKRNDFSTHYDNATAGKAFGLTLVHTFVSTPNDWDIYEGLQWFAADAFAVANPDDPDVPKLLERVAKEKEVYLKWGRDTLNWAIYLFRAP